MSETLYHSSSVLSNREFLLTWEEVQGKFEYKIRYDAPKHKLRDDPSYYIEDSHSDSENEQHDGSVLIKTLILTIEDASSNGNARVKSTGGIVVGTVNDRNSIDPNWEIELILQTRNAKKAKGKVKYEDAQEEGGGGG